MRVLVTGGAGYIGSHVVRLLTVSGHVPIVLDDLKEGHPQAVGPVRLIQGDIADPEAVGRVFSDGPIDAIIHMAASCQVGESMEHPARYYDNNVVRMLRFLDLVSRQGVRRIVFSSTAAVYGDPQIITGASATAAAAIDEDHPCVPTNVYGETKLTMERVLSWYCRQTGWSAITLRYFNAAGAEPDGTIGEDHEPESHLIPLVMKTALGLIPHLTIMGRDYPTPDGTCLRDYIHVSDLAAAHVLALAALTREGNRFSVYNLGAQRATSVLELVGEAGRVTGGTIRTVDGPRRAGDPPVLLASSERITRELGWKPVLSDLKTILKTAWNWHQAHPQGYH